MVAARGIGVLLLPLGSTVMKKILVLSGSLRKDSLNTRLAGYIATNLPDGYEATSFDIGLIPLYNSDLEGDNTPPNVQHFRDALNTADGVFWTSPEYNYAIPGVVKNAIDWASRPMMPKNSIVGKPMNAVIATMSPTNGVRALADIKRLWNNCGGYSVMVYDTVLQAAHTRFVDENGAESLEPIAKKAIDLCIGNLVSAIELNAGATSLANWEALVASMK
jgi:chromate reductase, NAD(P)H dehydrogenase (quinone)